MSYGASNISVLKGLEGVQKRPGMYVGDLGEAFFHLIKEAVDNAIDEHVAGHGNHITVSLNNINDEYVARVVDDGRGIPVDIHPTEGRPAVEVIMTVLHSGGKFGDESYKFSGGLHGVGISVANALSKWLEVRIHRNNNIYFMRFEKGIPVTELEIIGTTNKTGTDLSFSPDFTIIDENIPTKEIISTRLKELSYLNENLIIDLDYNGEKSQYLSKDGVADYVGTFIGLEDRVLDKPIFFNGEFVKVAFWWSKKDLDHAVCFTNSIKQSDGGTHLIGFRSAITKTVMHYIEQNKIKSKAEVISEDVRSGLCAVIAIKVQEPVFSSQTKNRLVTASARGLVEHALSEYFEFFLEKNPKEAQKIIKHICLCAESREAANRTKEAVKKTTTTNIFSSLGKIADCQLKDPTLTELFLVEGDSAGGSAKSGRDRRFQAILPLKGKILNVERASLNKIINCESIVTLISVLGAGFDSTFNIEKLRYHRIIIMVDADVDGAHIMTLIITFFIKCMPEVITRGYLYVAEPPLFKVTIGKQKIYLPDNEGLETFLFDRFMKNNVIKNFETNEDLTTDEIKDLLYKSMKLEKYITDLNSVVDLKVLSAVHTYDDKSFLKYANRIFDGKVKLENNMLEIISIYGKEKFILPQIAQEYKINMFPVVLNNVICYEPVLLLELIQKRKMQGITIQRYKGLGEMNPDELYDTTLNTNCRSLSNLTVDDLDTAIAEVKEIMGNENDRRKLVLDYLLPLFGLM